MELKGTERESMRQGNLLLADHSHAVTTIDEGATLVYAVHDAVRVSQWS